MEEEEEEEEKEGERLKVRWYSLRMGESLW
jgi:hypothetical protein